MIINFLWIGLFIVCIYNEHKIGLFVMSMIESVISLVIMFVWTGLLTAINDIKKQDISVPVWIFFIILTIFCIIPNILNYWQAILIVQGDNKVDEQPSTNNAIRPELEAGNQRKEIAQPQPQPQPINNFSIKS